MSGGCASLQYTFWGFLTAGFSSLTLFFRETRGKRIAVVKPGDARPAFRCGRCGGLFVIPDEADLPEESDTAKRCGRCGVLLEPDRLDCHWCGWGKNRTRRIRTPEDLES